MAREGMKKDGVPPSFVPVQSGMTIPPRSLPYNLDPNRKKEKKKKLKPQVHLSQLIFHDLEKKKKRKVQGTRALFRLFQETASLDRHLACHLSFIIITDT